MAHEMPITVLSDRILIGEEFVPRFLSAPQVLQVLPGQTVTLSPNSTYDYIENQGTLRILRNVDTVLHVTHLFNLPEGVLDFGTAIDPIPADRTVDIILRGTPIDLTRDPFTWGNGILNFSQQTRVGAMKTSRLRIADVQAGATTLTLASTPVGWRVGDELLLPDTKRPSGGIDVAPRREAPVFITAINGTTVTLSKPLDFEHITWFAPPPPDAILYPAEAAAWHAFFNGIGAPAGDVIHPICANLTRNITIKSESTLIPGHTANIGEEACWDIRGNVLSNLGRTTTAPLDNTTADASGNVTHQGTHQQGRYTHHNHHAHHSHDVHPLDCEDIGNVYRGMGTTGSKWGHVTHGSHDTLIEDCIVVDFPGAGFVTEDGYEVRNAYKYNLAAYILPSQPIPYPSDIIFPPSNIRDLRPGSEGTGLWQRGVKNTYIGNTTFNCFFGVNLFNQNQVAGYWPSVPGIEPDTLLNNRMMVPIEFTENANYGNVGVGLDLWSLEEFANDRSICVNNGASAVNAQISEVGRPSLLNPLFVNTDGKGFGINSDGAYVSSLKVVGGYVGGFEDGLPKAGANAVTFIRTLFQNVVNMRFGILPRILTHDHVTHLHYGSHPFQTMILWDGAVWKVGDNPLHSSELGTFPFTGAEPYPITDWQGTGIDYLLFPTQSRAELPCWPSGIANDVYNPPESGLTMGQAWEKYQISFHQGAVDAADAILLPGVENGVARAGLSHHYGPPQGVMTFPTLAAPATIEDNTYLRLFFLLTGDPTVANGVVRMQVDSGQIWELGPNPEAPSDTRRPFAFRRDIAGTALDSGTHTVRTWRYSPTGVILPASERTYSYFVGDIPPPQTIPVPSLIGMTVATAQAAVISAGLLPLSTGVHNPAPLGEVISQSPTAGTLVLPGSTVNIVASLGPDIPPPQDWATVTGIIERFGTTGRFRILVDGVGYEFMMK